MRHSRALRRKCYILIVTSLILTIFFMFGEHMEQEIHTEVLGDTEVRAIESGFIEKHLHCSDDAPCVYEEELDLRIIVLTYNRAESLTKCLHALQGLSLDGARAAVEIWVDRSVNGTVDDQVMQVVINFRWKLGRTRVHVRQTHVGIYGQWIYSWGPRREHTSEVVIILEDDIDLSPYFYRWLRAAHQHYDSNPDVAGYGLSDIEIPTNWLDHYVNPSADEVAFKFVRFSTFGFSPKSSVWRDFQSWYSTKKDNPLFHPYTKSDPLFTKWYKVFEKDNKTGSMWSMWFINFAAGHNLTTVYPNCYKYLGKRYPELLYATGLSYHRREKGLHFSSGQARSSKDFLLQKWYPELVSFSPNITIYKIPPLKLKRRIIRRIVSQVRSQQENNRDKLVEKIKKASVVKV